MALQKFQKIVILIQNFIRSSLFKSSLYVSLSKVIASVFNLVFMIYSVNILSKTDNGQFQYYLGFLPLILALAEFGLPGAIVKYLSPNVLEPKLVGRVLASSLVIKLISFLGISLLGLFTVFGFKEDPLVVAILIVGGVSFSFVTYFESILISFRAYKILSVWNPMTNLLRLLVLYLSNHYSSLPLSYLDILSIFCISPVFVLILFFLLFDRGKLFWEADSIDLKEGIKELTMFNLWAFSASMFAIASDRLEIFFLKKYHPAEVVAIYGTALQLFSGFLIILSTVNSMLLPGLSRTIDKEEFRSYLFKSVLVSAGIAILLSPGFFLGDPIFTILYKNKYAESIPVYQILYPNYLLQLVFAPFGIALFAMGKPKILAALAFIRLFCGFILDNLLIPELGVMGAGLSFFLGQVISWLILLGYFWAILWK
jgi:O-antigen/teichoic acid export membrane protein